MNIITHLQKRLESILDNDLDSHDESIVQNQARFEAVTDPRLLRGLAESLPRDNADKAVILFSRLSLYFDAGIFLEADGKMWEPQAQFDRGHINVLKQKQKISLPTVTLMNVLKTPAAPILKKLNLEKLDPSQKMNCLFLRPGEDFAFLLFSSLPELWLKEHIRLMTEAIHKGLHNE